MSQHDDMMRIADSYAEAAYMCEDQDAKRKRAALSDAIAAQAAEIARLQENWTGCAETCSLLHKANEALRAERDALLRANAELNAECLRFGLQERDKTP